MFGRRINRGSDLTGRRTMAGVGVTILTLAMGVGWTACDDDPAAPGGDDTGTVEAVVTDDPQSASPSAATLVRRSTAPAAVFTGTASGDFRVDISTDGSTWVQLGSLNGISLELQSAIDETSVHGEQTVAAGTYTRVRLVLENAAADLSAGSVIGGITLGADASVSVAGGGQVVIERAVQFQVTASSRTRVVFDLNSEAWITESAVTAGTAAQSEVEASVAAAAFAQVG